MCQKKVSLIKSAFCLMLAFALYPLAVGQTLIKADTTHFFRLYTGTAPFDEQFNSSLTNLSGDTISLRWTVEKGPNWPIDWDIYVSDQTISFAPGITTSPIPTVIMPGDSNYYFSSGIFFNNTPGCAEYQVLLADYDQDSVYYDTISYVLNVNDPNCGLTPIEASMEIDLEVFPNPIGDYFRVQSSQRYKGIKCYDLLGRELMSWPRTSSERYDLSSLVPGSYWLILEMGDGRFVSHKVVKY